MKQFRVYFVQRGQDGAERRYEETVTAVNLREALRKWETRAYVNATLYAVVDTERMFLHVDWAGDL